MAQSPPSLFFGRLAAIIWLGLLLFLVCAAPGTSAQSAALPENVAVHVKSASSGGSVVAADSHQVLVFDSDSLEREGRYQLPVGQRTFCLSGGGGSYTAFRITNSNGEFIVPVLNRRGCATVSLPEGITTVKL